VRLLPAAALWPAGLLASVVCAVRGGRCRVGLLQSAPGARAVGRARGGAHGEAGRGGQVTYLRGFYADERVMAYVRAGHLVLQPWTDLAECAGPAHMKCWQTMVYSHAALDAWGSGTAYLLYADPDEYLVFPNQAAVGSVGDVLRWCTNDAAQARAPPRVQLRRPPAPRPAPVHACACALARAARSTWKPAAACRASAHRPTCRGPRRVRCM
jgi:hypothetical protein